MLEEFNLDIRPIELKVRHDLKKYSRDNYVFEVL